MKFNIKPSISTATSSSNNINNADSPTMMPATRPKSLMTPTHNNNSTELDEARNELRGILIRHPPSPCARTRARIWARAPAAPLNLPLLQDTEEGEETETAGRKRVEDHDVEQQEEERIETTQEVKTTSNVSAAEGFSGTLSHHPQPRPPPPPPSSPSSSSSTPDDATQSKRDPSLSSLSSTSFLTRSERAYLESLLTDCKDVKQVRRAAERLSDGEIFLLPEAEHEHFHHRNGSSRLYKQSSSASMSKVAVGNGKQEEVVLQLQNKSKRDAELQRQLFRVHERGLVRPSTVIKRMSSLRYPPPPSHALRRSDVMNRDVDGSQGGVRPRRQGQAMQQVRSYSAPLSLMTAATSRAVVAEDKESYSPGRRRKAAEMNKSRTNSTSTATSTTINSNSTDPTRGRGEGKETVSSSTVSSFPSHMDSNLSHTQQPHEDDKDYERKTVMRNYVRAASRQSQGFEVMPKIEFDDTDSDDDDDDDENKADNKHSDDKNNSETKGEGGRLTENTNQKHVVTANGTRMEYGNDTDQRKSNNASKRIISSSSSSILRSSDGKFSNTTTDTTTNTTTTAPGESSASKSIFTDVAVVVDGNSDHQHQRRKKQIQFLEEESRQRSEGSHHGNNRFLSSLTADDDGDDWRGHASDMGDRGDSANDMGYNLGDDRTDNEVRPSSEAETEDQQQQEQKHVLDEINSWELAGNDEDFAVDKRDAKEEIYCHQPDAWDVLRDEYSWGYGYNEDDGGGSEGGNALPFKILGTSADDASCHPHVLSPPLMESVQSFMPETSSDCNYWLKFSLVRDGPSLFRLLRNVRGSFRTVLAIETTKGYVLGSYTCVPWRAHWGYYGSKESFVWRMRRSRLTPCHSIVEQAMMESELEVFPYTGANESVQLCRRDKIGLGGGEIEPIDNPEEGGGVSSEDKGGTEQHYGFAISLNSTLTHGTTSRSETFGSPCLTNTSARGEEFEVANLEVWALTPCSTVEEAEREEIAKIFFEEEGRKSKELNLLGILVGSPYG